MKYELLHPADQLVAMMSRIYHNGMTTSSGGNLSILDDNGDIWITPGGIDKGTLTRPYMCCIKPDGTILGPHKPSIELPIHASIYKKRPDIHAVLHAHPPSLVAFSVAHVLPDINLVLNARNILKNITIVEYAVPGSKLLGDNIAKRFENGYDVVVMENHGVVIGAGNIFDAFRKFETLEILSRIEINARRLGSIKILDESEISLNTTGDHLAMGDFFPNIHSPEECDARREMVELIARLYRRHLFGSTQGNYSARLSDGSFLITPLGVDRAYMDESDLVLIKGGMKEQGKVPSRTVKLHMLIYDKHPEIHSILGATPSHAMAFAVTREPFDPRTIPESYTLLREIKKVSCSSVVHEPELVAEMFSAKTPVLICENNQIIATGDSLFNAFDRLEVMEATARSIISAREIAGH